MRRDVLHAEREGREYAGARRVDQRGRVLERLDQTGLAVGFQRIGLFRNTQDFRRHGIAAQVAGAAVRGRVGQAHALNAAWVVGREFLALDRHRQLRMAVLLAQSLGAHGDLLAETFALAGHLTQIGKVFRRIEGQRNAAKIGFWNGAHLVHLHRRGDCRSERDRVHAVFVADVVAERQRLEIADPGGRAKRPGRLVLQPAADAVILLAALDREMVRVHLRAPLAGNRAAETRRVGHQIGLAVGRPWFGHGLAADLGRAVELHAVGIARRQGADLVDDAHQHLGAESRQAFTGDRVFRQDLLGALGRLQEGHRVLDRHADRAAHDEGFQVFRSHDRADARTSRGAVQIVDHGGEQAAAFAGLADRRDLGFFTVAFQQRLFGVPSACAPEVAGVLQFRLVVFDRQIDGLGGLAFENHHVPAGVLQLGAEESAGVRSGDGAGQRALAHHGPAAAGRRRGSGQRAGREDELVAGRQRVDLRVGFLDKIFGRQAALPEISLRPFHVQRFALAGARTEVHSQYLLRPGHFSPPLSDLVGFPDAQSVDTSAPVSVFSAHSRILCIPVASASTYCSASVGHISTQAGSPPQRSHLTTLPVSC